MFKIENSSKREFSSCLQEHNLLPGVTEKIFFKNKKRTEIINRESWKLKDPNSNSPQLSQNTRMVIVGRKFKNKLYPFNILKRFDFWNLLTKFFTVLFSNDSFAAIKFKVFSLLI